MDAHQRDAVVLWVVFTHAHDFFVFAPLLVILSPTKRCGKTRLQEVLARLAPRPQTMSGVSPAALARLIEEHRPTILISTRDVWQGRYVLLPVCCSAFATATSQRSRRGAHNS